MAPPWIDVPGLGFSGVEPATSEWTVPAPGSLEFVNANGGDEGWSEIRGRTGDGSSAGDVGDADDKMRPLEDFEEPAPSPVFRRPETESAPPPQVIEGEEGVPMGEVEEDVVVPQVGEDSVEAALPSALVGDGRRTEADVNAEQPQAQGQAAETANANPCKICFTNLEPQQFIYLNCGCLYCVECLNAHFRSGLANKASYPPRCCGQMSIDIEAVQGFLDDENMVRYTTVQEEFAADRPLYCANKECRIDFIGDATKVDLQGDERMVICYGCALSTCARCRELRDAHADNEGVLECPDSLALAEVKVMAEEQHWRRCPGCGFLVEKIDGCDHMICDCRTEFHYLCGQEYGNDGRCSCAQNPGWDDNGGQDGEDGDWGADPHDVHLEDQLPLDLQDDLHRPGDFPFIFDEDTELHPGDALQNIMEDMEMLLMPPEAEEDTDATAGITQAAQEEVIDGEGRRHDAGEQEVVGPEEAHRAVDSQEQVAGAVPADQIEEESENDEGENLRTANQTLRTALTGFRNATGALRTAAAAVVSGRRRRAERALRALQRADLAHGRRGRGAGRGGGGGRGRGGRGGGMFPIGIDFGDGEGEEQEDGDELDLPADRHDAHIQLHRARGRGGHGGAAGRGGLVPQGNEHEEFLVGDQAAVDAGFEQPIH